MNAESFKAQLQWSNRVARGNLDGITQAESLMQPPGGGNCANWVLGHLVASRSSFLAQVAGEPVWGEAERARYDRLSAPLSNPEDARPVEEIWEALDTSLERTLKAVDALRPEQLSARLPNSPTGNPEETLESLMTLFAFHDAYHTGQTGLLRRMLGRPSLDAGQAG